MERRPQAFHPLLFALYPLLELYSSLGLESGLSAILRSLLLVVGVCGLLWRVSWWCYRDHHRAALTSTIIIVALLYYGLVYRGVWSWSIGELRIGQHAFLLPLWFVFWGFMAMPAAWRRIRNAEWLTTFLNIIAAAAVLLSVGRYGCRQMKRQFVGATPGELPMLGRDFVELVPDSEALPDIYYIVVDGYGRDDVLEELYSFDNGSFLSFLREQGFYVAGRSRSNYVQTALSLASSLNLEYLKGLSSQSEDRSVLAQLIQDSLVYRSLSRLGYELVTVDSGYAPTRITSASTFLAPTHHRGLNEYESMLFLSSLGVVLADAGWVRFPMSGYEAHRSLTRYTFEALSDIPALEGPKFVFVHVMTPHPPFVYNREGDPVTPVSPYVGGLDGSFFPGSVEEYRNGYVEQLQHINTLLRDALPAIQMGSALPPIIVLQADHGPGSLLDWSSVERSCVWERTAILNAYYWPGAATEHLYPGISPVNTFRLMFDEYFGTDLGVLDDCSYYSTWQRPYEFFPITSGRTAVCGIE